MIDADLLGGCVDTLPGYAAAVRLLNCPLYSQVDSAPNKSHEALRLSDMQSYLRRIDYYRDCCLPLASRRADKQRGK